MGLLTSILGGLESTAAGRYVGRISCAELTGNFRTLLPVVLTMLANRGDTTPVLRGMGGLGGLLLQLGQKGFHAQVNSWMSAGQNQPLPTQAVNELFDSDQLAAIARQAGLTAEQARVGLSQLLPQVVDYLTPDGLVPELGQLLSSVDDYLERLKR